MTDLGDGLVSCPKCDGTGNECRKPHWDDDCRCNYMPPPCCDSSGACSLCEGDGYLTKKVAEGYWSERRNINGFAWE